MQAGRSGRVGISSSLVVVVVVVSVIVVVVVVVRAPWLCVV